MTPVRRILCAAFLFTASLCGLAASAHAACLIPQGTPSPCDPISGQCNSKGGRYRNLGGSDNGTRAYIAGSGHTNSTGQVVAWVGIQNNFTSTFGLVQIGEIQTRSNFNTPCGPGPFTDAFFEYLQAGGGHTYQCPYHSGIAQFGNGGLFDLVFQNGAWQAKQNGNNVGTQGGLNFQSGFSIASDEADLVKGSAAPAEAITFGPSGFNKWQFTTNNGSTYSDIQTSDCLGNYDTDPTHDTDGDWNLGGTPSPFNINWTGF